MLYLLCGKPFIKIISSKLYDSHFLGEKAQLRMFKPLFSGAAGFTGGSLATEGVSILTVQC